MKEPDWLAVLAEQFEGWVWDLSAPELHQREGPFLRDCAGRGVRLEQILGEEYQSDETLALAVQKQFCGKWAFVELFVNRYGAELRCWFGRWERNYRRDYHSEQDMAQELLLKFLKDTQSLAKYDASREFAPWLHVVARNLWIAQVARRRQPQPTDVLPELTTGITPQEELLAAELRTRLVDALRLLPPDGRKAMELTIQGLSPADVAAALGWRLPRVYRVLCKARKWLVAQLSLSLPPSARGRPKQARPEPPEHRSADQ